MCGSEYEWEFEWPCALRYGSAYESGLVCGSEYESEFEWPCALGYGSKFGVRVAVRVGVLGRS